MTKADNTMIVWSYISELSPDSRNINLRFKVLEIGETRQVFSKTTGREIELVESIIGDSTGKIILVLWNDDIDSIKRYHTYILMNGKINLYDESMTLSKGRNGEIRLSETTIDYVNEEVNMSKPFIGRPKRKSRSRTMSGRSFDGTAGREIRKFCGRKSF
ncbi:hypothetical protein EU527_09470 [Candidatus Thorarchaeota archaeon]|nr:MAG: hypothetical protein EU527_09470 [Candidatus Thorarchaeota archaeon]